MGGRERARKSVREEGKKENLAERPLPSPLTAVKEMGGGVSRCWVGKTLHEKQGDRWLARVNKGGLWGKENTLLLEQRIQRISKGQHGAKGEEEGPPVELYMKGETLPLVRGGGNVRSRKTWPDIGTWGRKV